MFENIKNGLLSQTKSERKFIFFAILYVLGITAEYGITRPVSTAIFTANFGAEFIPYAWLATVPLNFFIIYLYSRFLPKLGCKQTFLLVALFSSGVNCICAFLLPYFPKLIFFQFVWKDIYILLMFKQLWSLIHSTIDTKKSKYLYGFFFGVGGLGSTIGSFLPGFLAVKIGSESLLAFSLPIYALVCVFYSMAMNQSDLKGHMQNYQDMICPQKAGPREAFSLIRRSNLLIFILMIVIFMQISTAFLDYQFNLNLQQAIPDQDLRSQYGGRLGMIINSTSLLVQFLGTFVLVHVLGLKKSHLMVPIMLMMNGLLFLSFPSFLVISYCYAAIKIFDYSFFGVIREMLYVPLKLDEKFRAKAVIDVFAYRSAKAGASLLLLGFQLIPAINLNRVISYTSIVIFCTWSFAVVMLFRSYQKRVDQANAESAAS